MTLEKLNCLIIDEMYPNIGELLIDAGVTPDYQPDINRESVIKKIGAYEGLVVRSKTIVDRELLLAASKLQFIARAGAGLDQIDEDECASRGIQIFNAPEANCSAVGEHAVGMLLTLFNKINIGDRQIRQGIWEREDNRGFEIQGKTIGIIGFGNMGQAFAERLSGFECQILAYDKHRVGFGSILVNEVSLDEVFEKTDILSLHTPLTPETYGMINLAFIEKFSNDITLINTSRGKIVVLRDLIEALNIGKVKSAALDVLENENIDQLSKDEQVYFNDLIKRENVLLSPHVAGWTFESYEKINVILAAKIKKYINSLTN